MFFYRFGDQRSHNIYQSQHKSKSGDLVYFDDHYYLNLGDEISRPEQGNTTIHFSGEKTIPKLCTPQTLTLLHRMVNERFSNYNSCVALFFGNDIQVLLKQHLRLSRGIKGVNAASYKSQVVQSNNGNLSLEAGRQTLLIFPSVFSLTQYLKTNDQELGATLTGQSTTVARAKAYRSITNNTTHILTATHSQIFQNRHNLTTITVIDPYSPLYQTYHDPRYNLHTVVDKMREIYDIRS